MLNSNRVVRCYWRESEREREIVRCYKNIASVNSTFTHGISSCMSVWLCAKFRSKTVRKGHLQWCLRKDTRKHIHPICIQTSESKELINTSSCLKEFKGRNMITYICFHEKNKVILTEFNKIKIQHIPQGPGPKTIPNPIPNKTIPSLTGPRMLAAIWLPTIVTNAGVRIIVLGAIGSTATGTNGPNGTATRTWDGGHQKKLLVKSKGNGHPYVLRET